MRNVARLFLFFLSLVIFNAVVWPQSDASSASNSATKSANTPYIIDLPLNDSQVTLSWDGYWRISLVAGGAFGSVPDQNQFNSLSQGVNFFQEPDVTITLWLYNRWFLEATLLEGSGRNTYRVGYQGYPEEFVKEAIIGNSGITASSYAGMQIPKPQYNSPGLIAKFGTKKSSHELLLRYDPSESSSVTFQGPYRVRTQNIELQDYIRGQFFILPDTNISNVRVYLENAQGNITGIDADGSTHRYFQAEPVEYFVDQVTGIMELAQPHTGRVLVYYDVGNQPVGNTGNGKNFIVPPDAGLRPDFSAWAGNTLNLEDFNWNAINLYNPLGTQTYLNTSQVTIDGIEALMVYEPGSFTPFERQNMYNSALALPEELWRTSVRIQDYGDLYPREPKPSFIFTPNTTQRTISAFGAVGEDARYPANRYPFATTDPNLYGPGPETDSSKISRSMILAIRDNNSGYSLGAEVIPGSIVVHINGIEDKTVEVVDGSLKFKRFIYLNDWIEVTYKSESLELEDGNLYIYQGNRFTITPNLTWEIAESIRWNLSSNQTVEQYNESSGAIRLSSTLDWETEQGGIKASVQGILSTPDTAGNLRLFGMGKGRLNFGFFESNLFPAPSELPKIGFSSANRHNLRQYSYTETQTLGTTQLKSYLWDNAKPTGKDAGGVAAKDDGDPIDGNVMDLRFDIPNGGWSAADMIMNNEGPIDMSKYTGIEFPIMLLEGYGSDSSWNNARPPILSLQMGEIGESTDHHGDGSIHSAKDGAFAEWDFDVSEAWLNKGDSNVRGSWQTIEIPIAMTDRRKLESVRSMRWIVHNTSGEQISGRIIIGPPVFLGSSFRTDVRTANNTLPKEQNIVGDEITDNTLKTVHPETAEIFHSNGESNTVFRVRWGRDAFGNELEKTERWDAVSWFSEVPAHAYKNMVFFVKPLQTDSGTITAKITDAENKGYTLSWSPDYTEWDKITIDLFSGTATSERMGTLPVMRDAKIGQLTLLHIEGRDMPSGTIYFDEVYFTQPTYSIAGSGDVTGHWHYKEDVANWGKLPILGNISIMGRIEGSGGAILAGPDSDDAVVVGDVNFSADVIGVGLQTAWHIAAGTGDTIWSGNHNLRIPARSRILWFNESYSRAVTGTQITFSRLNSLNIQLLPGSFKAFVNARHDGNDLIQAWGGETSWEGKHWGAKIDVEYSSVSNNISTGKENYFASWIADYIYILPHSGSITSREAHHSLDGFLQWEPFHLQWEPHLRFKVNRIPKWSQENQWKGILRISLNFKNWRLTPSYSREFKQTLDTSIAGDSGNRNFGNAWQNLALGMQKQFPLITYIPFAELFGTTNTGTFYSTSIGSKKVDYQATFALQLKRKSGDSIADIFLPASTDLSIQRQYSRNGNTVGWTNIWSMVLGFQASELFGNFGRYPIFPFYNSEELKGIIQINLEDLNGVTVPDMKTLIWTLDWLFKGKRNHALVLYHRLDWDWTATYQKTLQKGRIGFQWRTPSKEVLRLPLIKRAIVLQHYLEHTESLEIQGTYPWTHLSSTSIFEMDVIIRHESKWVFEEVGHIKGWLAIGLGGYGTQFTNAWELGLELELRF